MATKIGSTAAVTLQGSCQLARDANGYRVEEVWGGGGSDRGNYCCSEDKNSNGAWLGWLWLQWSEWNEDWRNATGIAGCIMIMPNVPATCPMSV